jgi:hypothetical protein
MARKAYVTITFCMIAIWVGFSVDDHVFNGFEFATSVGFISLILGFIVYQRDTPERQYFKGQDRRHFLRRQSPLRYASTGVILAGLISLNGVVEKPFEIIGYVTHKYNRSTKGSTVHILDISHKDYGTLRGRVSKKLWLTQRVGSPILLGIQRNIFGQYVVKSVEMLEYK